MNQKRHVVDPEAKEIHPQSSLPQRVASIKNEKPERKREEHAGGVFGNNKRPSEKNDVDRGEFSKIDRKKSVRDWH
jgi:hypothetical protein